MPIPLPCQISVIQNDIRQNHQQQTATEISERYNVNPVTIWKIAKQIGVKIKISDTKPAERSEIISRVNFIRNNGSNMTGSEIAKALDMSYYGVMNLVRRHNLKIKKQRRPDQNEVVEEGFFFNVDYRENWMI